MNVAVGASGVASRLAVMSVTVELPAEAMARLEAEAARRGVGIETVIAELTEALPRPDSDETRRLAIAGVGASGGDEDPGDVDVFFADGEGRSRFGFIGMGHSGDGELSTRYQDYRRAATAAKTSDDV